MASIRLGRSTQVRVFSYARLAAAACVAMGNRYCTWLQTFDRD
jgi:hypothetical protein